MRETYFIPVEDTGEGEKYLIYRPLPGLAFAGNRAMAQLARRLADLPEGVPFQPTTEAEQFLADTGFLADDPIPGEDSNQLTTAVLLLTNRCQLRCAYCYAAAGAMPTSILKLDTAKTVIDYICDQAQRSGLPDFKVEFHGGGEPTLEWELLRACVAYAHSKPLPVKVSVTSNAVWSENQCQWLIDNMDFISVSMDGNEQTQDQNRPTANGMPSFPVVMRNLHTLDRQHFTYGIRMTATRPWNQLVENVRFILEDTTCRAIQVEPAFNTERGEHGEAGDGEVEKFVEAFKEAYLTARKAHAEFRYAGARPGIVTRRFCSAPYNAVVVNPADEIVACYEVVNQQHELASYSVFGRVVDGQVMLSKTAREKLHGLMDERSQQCAACFCRWSCAGDCYVRVFQPGKDGHLVFGERCRMNREITSFLLLSMIAEGNGLWSRNRILSNCELFPNG